MANWLDYVPVLGGLDDLMRGDIAGAALGASPIGPFVTGYNAYTGAQDELRKGYKDTVSSLKDEGEKQRQFQMQGLERAQNYYRPAQAFMQAAYGSPDMLRK